MLRAVNAMALKALSVILFAGAIMARVIHSRKRFTSINSSEDVKGNRRQDYLYSMYPYSDRHRSEPIKNPYYYRLRSDFGKDSYQQHLDRIVNNQIINDYQNEILEIPFLRQGQQVTPPTPPTPPPIRPATTVTSPPKANFVEMMTPPSIISPVSPIAALYEPIRIMQPSPPNGNIPMTPMRTVNSHETYGQKLFRTGLNFLLTKTLILGFLMFEMLMVYISKVLIIKPLKYIMDTMTGLAVHVFS